MWHREERWRTRLLAEQEVMRLRFPGFRLVEAEGGRLRWVGTLEPISGRHFLVSLRYPDAYPYVPPKFFIERPALRSGCPHRFTDGSVCIHKVQWNPTTGTAASCVPLVSAWLVAYLAWLENGQGF